MSEAAQSKSPPLSESYSRLAVNAAAKAGFGMVGGGLMALVFMKGAAMRCLLTGIGTGLGLGWGLKEADEYLTNPSPEKLPKTENFAKGFEEVREVTYSTCRKLFDVIPESWKPPSSK
ncbi:unnamed protein product [Vitrella brassicaformis CCMP3155]|uniref:MICOS complex subunit MIC10 n=1 Tax=Vitrella brassicaformis (strain CCMP3155) TaxID=1169540 RepID=A0A0G4EPA0_VITBC|nr:unnamed protein product [Vitrella brassicaformis CCMP3155]|eukprot:CEL99254.1 unnamed protein product [Vitrella brassicaformis CCMP3155]